MPELPEVETTRAGIEPHIIQQKVTQVIVRQANLRWPIPSELKSALKNQCIQAVLRRGKYLLLKTDAGTALFHLGMSGSLRILQVGVSPQKHDHVDIQFSNKVILRLNDPRRFGALLWTIEDPFQHPLLASLGPEPLTEDFSGDYLWQKAKGRKVAIKPFIMNNEIVVGVGNIYATEALFQAQIHPKRSANQIDKERYQLLTKCIKTILRKAIKKGGTTLKDFVNSKGNPGYFQQQLKVYGRSDLPCFVCQTKLKEIRLGQRSSVFCSKCQK